MSFGVQKIIYTIKNMVRNRGKYDKKMRYLSVYVKSYTEVKASLIVNAQKRKLNF